MIEDPSIWKQVANWLWGLLIPLGWYAVNQRDRKIEKLEIEMDQRASQKSVDELKDSIHGMRNRMITREDFKDHEVRDDKDRTERREQEVLLFEKVDDLKDDINTKFNALKDLIISRTK